MSVGTAEFGSFGMQADEAALCQRVLMHLLPHLRAEVVTMHRTCAVVVHDPTGAGPDDHALYSMGAAFSYLAQYLQRLGRIG